MSLGPRSVLEPGVLHRRRGVPPVEPWVVWGGLALLTAVAAALRLPFLGHASLWFDETFTRAIVAHGSLGGMWHAIRTTESTPPLYYLLAKLCTLLAGVDTAEMLRLPATLSLILAVPVTFMAFRRWLGTAAAFGAAAVVAVDPLLVGYALDARSYGLLVLTGLLSMWALAAVLDDGGPLAWAGWVIASIACIWSHYFGAFLVAGEAVALLALRPVPRRVTVLMCVVVGAACAPLVSLVLAQNATRDAAFIAGIPLGTRLEQTVRQFGMGANVPRAWLEGAGLAVLGGAVLAGGISAARQWGGRLALWLILWAAALPLVLALIGLEDRFYVRNVIAAVPLMAVLGAPWLVRLRGAPLAVYSVLAILCAVWVSTNWRYEQPDWRTAIASAQAMEHAPGPGRSPWPILTVGVDSTPVAAHYLGAVPLHRSVVTRRILLVVQPARGPHSRGLAPAPVPSGVTAALAGFGPRATRFVHGFRLTWLVAHRPLAVQPALLAGAAMFAG